MYVIGLAGNIGTGKSTVAGILAGFGAAVIDADQVSHHILENKQTYAELVDTFGNEILEEDGKIDRKKLAAVAFGTAEGTVRLNSITHPRIKQTVHEKLDELRGKGVDFAIVEAAMMVKKNWAGIINEMWVTTSPQDVIIRRMRDNRGYKEEDTLQRLQRQMTPQEMVDQADMVINTDFPLKELELILKKLWDEMQSRIGTIRD